MSQVGIPAYFPGTALSSGLYITGIEDTSLPNARVKRNWWYNKHFDDQPIAPFAENDEFEAAALDPKWTIVNDPGGLSLATHKGMLASGDIAGMAGAANIVNLITIYQAPPAFGTLWEMIAKVQVAFRASSVNYGQYGGIGIGLLDRPNTKFVGCAAQMTNTGATGHLTVSGLHDNGAGTLTTMTTTFATNTDSSSFVFLRLKKATANIYTNANTYEAWYSKDGVEWCFLGSVSKTMVANPNELGLYIRKSDAGTVWVAADFYRRLV